MDIIEEGDIRKEEVEDLIPPELESAYAMLGFDFIKEVEIESEEDDPRKMEEERQINTRNSQDG